MKKDKNDKYDEYYDTYNRIASRYNYDEEASWWPEMLEVPTRHEKMSTARHRLLNILQEIAVNSGFNTNAPDEMYATAEKLFEDLSCNLDEKSKSFNKNKTILKDAKWALFNKFDYMRAKDLIQRVK